VTPPNKNKLENTFLSNMAPLLSRKKDIIYLLFFATHIPIVFRASSPHHLLLHSPPTTTRDTRLTHPLTSPRTVVDIYPLYPPHLIPTFMTSLRHWYITAYRDQFFISPPAWFGFYTWMELLYHAPLSLWAVQALARDDPKLPLHLLVYAVQTAVTTATCVAEYLSWDNLSGSEKLELGKLCVVFHPLLSVDFPSLIISYSVGDYMLTISGSGL
jgi:hypothetical protein